MVSEERKMEIIEEERLRLNIRDDLCLPKNESLTTWRFFNSNLGLLLISSVFISFFSWFYQSLDDSRKAETENTRIVEKLRNEIAYRSQSVRSILPDTIAWEELYDFDFIFDGVEKSWLQKPVYPEFQNRAIPGLAYELYSRSKKDDRILAKKLFDSSLIVSATYKKLVKISITDERDDESDLREHDILMLREANKLFKTFSDINP
ncbi:MAG: hypothetical protein E2O76_18430 [Caldithrix sp.]|nr:MAG: hypothetical protein E2O76_18430 [Caldithrix sp.]